MYLISTFTLNLYITIIKKNEQNPHIKLIYFIFAKNKILVIWFYILKYDSLSRSGLMFLFILKIGSANYHGYDMPESTTTLDQLATNIRQLDKQILLDYFILCFNISSIL